MRGPAFAQRLAAAAAALWLAFVPAAAETGIPRFWDTAERLTKPDLSSLPRLRFLTTTDFPPFNFLDAGGRLTGFHVDLARALCMELGVLERCEIQALPFAELEGALMRGDGEAIVAGLAVTEESRARYAFTRSYLQFPARFAMRKEAALSEPLAEKIAGKRVGVIAGSAHEAMLRAFFPDVRAVTYSRAGWLYGDLKEERIDAAFGDGMRIGFWLGSTESAGCCRFAGGPYLAPDYLGRGLAIAVRPENAALAAGFDYALRELHSEGVFAELYLRYFPVGFY